MGLFSSFSGGMKTATASVSPSSLLGPTGSFSTAGLATDALMGGAEGGMRDLLGMDPKVECPAGGGGSSSGASGDNDPCGQNDDPLKAALLGLGMGLAGPTIGAMGDILGGAMDSGLGAVTGAIGGALAGTSAGIGGMLGLDPDGPGQSMMNGVIGAGAAVGLGGGSSTDAGIGALSSLTGAITKPGAMPSAISGSTVASANSATSVDSGKVSTSVFDSVKSFF